MQVSDEMLRAAIEVYAANDAHTSLIDGAAMRAALETALAAMWRPTEDAPINRAVLIKTSVPDYYGNAGVYEAMLVDMGSGKRWHTFGYAVGRDIGGDFKPTHWAPLPQPPRHKEG